METNRQEIVSLICKMRTQEVNKAEDLLIGMANNMKFMEIVFDIIGDGQYENWIRTIASTFLNRVICEKIEEMGYANMFQALKSIMESNHVTSQDKRCFERSLITLIQYIKQPDQIDVWRNFILKCLSNEQLFDTGLLLISCTVIAEFSTDYLCVIVQETFELTLKAKKISIENAMIINQLVKNWIVVFDKLITLKDQQSVHQTLIKISKSQILAKLLFQIHNFNSPGEIWLCIQPQLYQLNILKYVACQLHSKVANFALAQKISANHCKSLLLISQYYHTIKNTIAVVGTNMQIIQSYQCQDYVTELISLLIVYIKLKQNHPVNEMNILMHIVCFPFLGTRDQEIYIFQQSPVQFNALAQDICDKQTFGILKTEAAKLLQTISDHCRDAMQTAILFCIQCLKMKIGYIPLTKSQQIKILQIQTAFQILCIFSFSLENYQNQLQQLKTILCDKRIMELSALQLSKVFLFLAYNYGEVFKNPLDGGMWIQYALSYNKHPTTRYMGLDFISNVCDEYFTETFFIRLVKLLIDCEQKESGQVWSIVLKIFSTQKQCITQQLCLMLVNTIFQRIQKQITALESKKKESTIDIINALHILRKIVEEREYIETKESLKQRIFKITVAYTKMIDYNVEDQIIKIIIQFLKIDKNQVRPQIYSLLPHILQHFKKEQYHEKAYFILFNELIIRSKYQIIKPVIKTLLTGLMFHLFDMSPAAKKIKMKVAIANILIVLQNLLSIHGYQMSLDQNCLYQIAAMCIRLFPCKQDQKIFNRNLLSKALNLMFLCHLYNRAEQTVNYVIKYGKQKIFHKYDAYILIKLLSKALFSQQNVNIVIEYLSLMVQIGNEEQKNEKKGMSIKTAKGKMKLKRDEQLGKILQKISSPFLNMDYKNIEFHSQIKKQLIECLTRMKLNNMETYKLIIMNMSEQQKNKLTKLVNQTVEVDGKSRVIRKIAGIKLGGKEQNGEMWRKNEENSDLEQIEGEDEKSFKRQRILTKKKEHKKKPDNKISTQ